MWARKMRAWIMANVAVLACCAGASAAVVHVDKDNVSGIEDGASWATAFTTLQPAMNAAAPEDSVWIAEGIYDEPRGDDNFGAVYIKSKLHVFGGFAGTETSLDQRDPVSRETIVDGSKSYRDGAAPCVIITTDDVEIDGLTIQGGRALGSINQYLFLFRSGGGILACSINFPYGEHTEVDGFYLRNCTFRDNQSIESGAPLFFYSINKPNVVVQNCLFEGNGIETPANWASLIEVGIANYTSGDTFPEFLIDGCTFRNNSENYATALSIVFGVKTTVSNCLFEQSGGRDQILATSSDVLTVRDCRFLNSYGTALTGLAEKNATVERSIFKGKEGVPSQGGISIYVSDNLHVSGCLFDSTGNFDTAAPSILVTSSTILDACTFHEQFPLLLFPPAGSMTFLATNCILQGELLYMPDSPPDIRYSLLDNPTPGEGNIAGDPRFADAQTGDFRLLPDSPCIDAGAPNAATSRDIAGNWRPQGGAMDMGAYESGQTDSDSDGIFDDTEGTGDFDRDDIPDYLDPDSDGDSIPDAEEGIGDLDNDLAPSYLDLDSDGDGVDDAVEARYGFDPQDAGDVARDDDGDGLRSIDELFVYFTNPYWGDSDQDGMRDGWEVEHGLNPLENDAAGDPDGDNLPNIFEYGLGSDSHDAQDPYTDVYVATDGSDDAPGAASAPWATIMRAMTAAQLYTASNLYVHPLTIHLGAGVFEERVEMMPQTILSGAGQDLTALRYFNPADDEHIVVNGAENCALEDLTLTLPGIYADIAALMRIDNVVTNVSRVTFNGKFNQNSTGILITGPGSSASQVSDCVFKNLNDAIWAVDSGVNITRNTFDTVLKDAVFISPPETGAKSEVAPVLGDVSLAGATGGNIFRGVDGRLVRNLGDADVIAQNNDWGIYDETDIAEKMYGSVNFVPFLKQDEGETEGDTEGTVEGDTEGTVESETEGNPEKPKFLAFLGCGASSDITSSAGDLLALLAVMAGLALSRRRKSRAISSQTK